MKDFYYVTNWSWTSEQRNEDDAVNQEWSIQISKSSSEYLCSIRIFSTSIRSNRSCLTRCCSIRICSTSMRSDRSHSAKCCLISMRLVKCHSISSKPVSIFSSRSYSIRICPVRCCFSSRSYLIRSCSVNLTCFNFWTSKNNNQISPTDSLTNSATVCISCDCKKVEWSKRRD